MKRPWTRGEKWLFATPMLFGVAVLGLVYGPSAISKAQGYPTKLPVASGTRVVSLSLSGNGNLLVAGTQELENARIKTNTIHLWDARTLQPLPPLTRGAGRVFVPAAGRVKYDSGTFGVTLSPDARLLAWSSVRDGFTVTDLQSRRALWSMPSKNLRALAFSRDGQRLALTETGKSVQIFEARTGQTVAGWDLRPAHGEVAFAFSPQGHYFASTGARPPWNRWAKKPNEHSGAVELRRVFDWKVERVLPMSNTFYLAFAPDERSLIAIGKRFWAPFIESPKEYLIRCFDLSTGSVKWEIEPQNPDFPEELVFVREASYSPDGTTVAVVSNLEDVILLDANSGEMQRQLPTLSTQWSGFLVPHHIAFSPDGKRLYAGSGDGVLVWDLE